LVEAASGSSSGSAARGGVVDGSPRPAGVGEASDGDSAKQESSISEKKNYSKCFDHLDAFA